MFCTVDRVFSSCKELSLTIYISLFYTLVRGCVKNKNFGTPSVGLLVDWKTKKGSAHALPLLMQKHKYLRPNANVEKTSWHIYKASHTAGMTQVTLP